MIQTALEFDKDKPAKVKKFEKYHAKHPRVYKAFRKKALDLIGKKPIRVISGRMIFESVRYDIFIQNDEAEIYKLNNDYCPAYIRLFIRNHPAYAGLIKIKDSVFDNWI